MLLHELGECIKARGDQPATAAFEACARAISNLTLLARVVDCDEVPAPRSGFVIHVMFPASEQALPFLELRHSPRAHRQISVHLVSREADEYVELSDELAKADGELYAIAWDAVCRATSLIERMSPPLPNGQGLMSSP